MVNRKYTEEFKAEAVKQVRERERGRGMYPPLSARGLTVATRTVRVRIPIFARISAQELALHLSAATEASIKIHLSYSMSMTSVYKKECS
jgi:hypothetical protein